MTKEHDKVVVRADVKPLKYFLDAEGYYPYLLFSDELSVEQAGRVRADLDRRGIGTTDTQGKSSRPASNGRKYAYYIRLEVGFAASTIHRVLRDFGLIRDDKRAPTRTNESERRLLAFVEESQRQTRELAAILDRLNRPDTSDRTIVSEDDWRDLCDSNDGLQVQVESLRARNEELVAENGELKGQVAKSPRTPGENRRAELIPLLRDVVPSVEFERDSASRLDQEFYPCWGEVLKLMLALQDGDQIKASKRVRDTGNWMESTRKYRVSSGPDLGRIYWLRKGRAVRVIASTKGRQDRDIAWMRNNGG